MKNIIITSEQMQNQINLLIKSSVIDTNNISLVDMIEISSMIHEAVRFQMIEIITKKNN